mmetsp:Transcript_47257/g.119693  ORF Transcript_47257/g.119693 Transcript_47257/m.119693 type:complete len:201 (-) Transcript_47257:385-987(-)
MGGQAPSCRRRRWAVLAAKRGRQRRASRRRRRRRGPSPGPRVFPRARRSFALTAARVRSLQTRRRQQPQRRFHRRGRPRWPLWKARQQAQRPVARPHQKNTTPPLSHRRLAKSRGALPLRRRHGQRSGRRTRRRCCRCWRNSLPSPQRTWRARRPWRHGPRRRTSSRRSRHCSRRRRRNRCRNRHCCPKRLGCRPCTSRS